MQNPETNLILIVDDTPTNLEVLSEALTDAGFDVAVATSGESAIKQVEYEPPELILLDVMMPGIDGFETCYRLKTNPKTQHIPIIFMTALADTVDKVKGLSLGAVDYITKPFQQAEALARIQIHLKLQNVTLALEKQNVRLQQEIQERVSAELALQKLTQELEQRVADRTKELSQALQDLQKAQVKLIQSEKLATLGQLVAGVAHEINNPVNFIHGNLQHASCYIEDLLELINLYQTQFPNSNPEIAKKSKEIDLEFLRLDLPKIISSMAIGTQRIQEIVQSFRNFSRHDEAEVKKVNIHDGLNSTLMLIDHRLKAKPGYPAIQLIKDYGNLPAVECFAGKMNQVFMNVLSNAIDALEELMGNEQSFENSISPIIRIHTEVVASDRIMIRIADNGPGITEIVQKRVFDPFFTTKPAGKGTGLGMSISHQIVVEKHGGSLYCVSCPGNGAEFVIEIPIKQENLPDPSWWESPDLSEKSMEDQASPLIAQI
ncbi:response regulator [Tolypothrix sp. FACHB-123]|uniref:hybrid sensor histidine kinase/response regulator n=1 Tax=Tolypothrix sp. FACHB-123 TaxID=2692868 RepID=UPI001689DDCF|nr:response regulator [Tolypothrix sp. FACHB-123]MBD2357845.1 response regulator [Tolypothrix sp. FACHB-123]